ALQAAPRIERAGLFRPDGRLFASYVRDPAQEPLTLPDAPAGLIEWHAFEGLRRLHVIRRIVLSGQPIGVVYIRSDLQEAGDRLKVYGLIVAGVLLVSLVAAQVVSRASSRAISDPIAELAAVAHSLSADRD